MDPMSTYMLYYIHDAMACFVSHIWEHFLNFSWHRVKCHKIMMIYPQPIRRHYHPKYTLITLAPVSYLRSLVVRAVHRHRTGVGSIPAGGPYSWWIFLNCSRLEFRHVYNFHSILRHINPSEKYWIWLRQRAGYQNFIAKTLPPESYTLPRAFSLVSSAMHVCKFLN